MKIIKYHITENHPKLIFFHADTLYRINKQIYILFLLVNARPTNEAVVNILRNMKNKYVKGQTILLKKKIVGEVSFSLKL